MDIKAIKTVTRTDNETFDSQLSRIVDNMEKNNLKVEIQYAMATDEDAQNIIYSALVIGREKQIIVS
jgi:hypothetical protein